MHVAQVDMYTLITHTQSHCLPHSGCLSSGRVCASDCGVCPCVDICPSPLSSYQSPWSQETQEEAYRAVSEREHAPLHHV